MRNEKYPCVPVRLCRSLSEDEMIIAAGVTVTGEKVVLGFVQAASENERVIKGFLSQMHCPITGVHSALPIILGKFRTKGEPLWPVSVDTVVYPIARPVSIAP